MTSTLSRHRPAVLTAVTITLGCSLWYAYTAYQTKPASPLHRSNAVHRRQNPVRSAQATNSSNDDNDITAIRDDQNESASPDQHDAAETVAGGEPAARHQSTRDGTNLKELLYYIAEDQSRLNGYIHRGVMCNGCYMKPIRGVRWRCANCADYDLCSDCEATGMHSKTHIFYKVKIPAPFLGNPRQSQPVAYPGRPEEMARELPAEVAKKLAAQTRFDKEEIDALYDQFTCLANTDWPEDPLNIDHAIDRRAFDTAFIPLSSISAPGPNLLYDRIFAFYDTDRDGLIGFEELLVGLSHVKQKSRDSARRRLMIFNGFDLDGDNYICRRDVLRLFRAYYAIQKDITHDLIAVQEEELDLKNVSTLINGSQPLSAVFTEPPPPASTDTLPFNEKVPNRFGEHRHGVNALFESSNDECPRLEVLQVSAHEAHKLDGYTSDQTESINHTLKSCLLDRQQKNSFYTDAEEGWFPQIKDNMIESPLRTPLGYVRTASIWYENSNDNQEYIERPADTAPVSEAQEYTHGPYRIAVNLPDTSVGGEILYQVVLEGLNELLDPLFWRKEDLALEVDATIQEREDWRELIEEYGQALHEVEEMRESSRQSSKSDVGSEESAVNSAATSDYEISRTINADSHSKLKSILQNYEMKDQTMPQFRPNSSKDIRTLPTPARLKRLHELNMAAQDIEQAGGPGRLSLEEFQTVMEGEHGRKLAFVDSWFELGSF